LPKYQRKTPLPDKSKGEVSIGRPTVVNDTVIPKLVDAFSLGCTDEEACLYADIGMSTLYKYQEANPEFVERKKLLKQKPFLKARNTVIKHLDDPDHAEWYLERKGKNEFGMKTAVEYSNADAEGITNAEIIKSAFLALPPEERAAIVSEVSKPPDEVKPV
jgi:hypothetical protein